MQLPQLGAGIDAELIGDQLAGLRVGLQGLRLPARGVQGLHEQGPQLLPERVIGEQPAQLGHHLGVPAAAEVGLDAQLQRLDPGLLQAARLGADQR